MRKALLPLLLLLPVAAYAQEPQCRHSQPVEQKLDLAGVKAVVFDIGSNDLTIVATPGGKGGIRGKACASDQKYLGQLKIAQRKSGDKLYVAMRRESAPSRLFFGSNYAYLKLDATLPDSLTVQLKVDSGDASVTGAAVLSADVGSGDLRARRIRGLVAATVGSGDIVVDDIGSLNVISVSSGDFSAKNVRGPVKVGSVGSGDLTVEGTKGDVEIGSVGSGDATVSGVSGSVRVESLGSGDIEVRDIRGDLSLESRGSGAISHNRIDGRVSVPGDD